MGCSVGYFSPDKLSWYTARLIRPGGRLVTIAGPTGARPANGSTVDFVVEANPNQLSQIVNQMREGRLNTNIGSISSLENAVATFSPANRVREKR